MCCPCGKLPDMDATLTTLRPQLEAALAPSPHATDVVIYPGAGHAFMNETRPEAFRPDAAKDAWVRMVAFFRDHLGS